MNIINNLTQDGCYGYRPKLMIINEQGKCYSTDKQENVYVSVKDTHGEASACQEGALMAEPHEEQGP